jgi:hypothetical protein
VKRDFCFGNADPDADAKILAGRRPGFAGRR